MKVDLKPRLKVDFRNFSRNRYIPNEAYFLYYKPHFENAIGFQKISWGSSIFFNPTDVINRKDYEDNFYTPDKLGDVVLSAKTMTEKMGFLSDISAKLLIMPVFYETPLPENDTRFALTGNFGVIPFQKDIGQDHPDSYAKMFGAALDLRATTKMIDWQFIYYHGPERDPGFYLRTNNSGNLVIRPFYYNIDMIGLNAEANFGKFVFHAEVAFKITKLNDARTHQLGGNTTDIIPDTYLQYVPGIEYTIDGLFGGGSLIFSLEYLSENKREASLEDLRPFKNDIFFGTSLDFGNVKQSKIEVGAVKDLSNRELAIFFSLTTKLIKELKLAIEGAIIRQDPNQNEPLSFFDNNSFIQSKLSYTF